MPSNRHQYEYTFQDEGGGKGGGTFTPRTTSMVSTPNGSHGSYGSSDAEDDHHVRFDATAALPRPDPVMSSDARSVSENTEMTGMTSATADTKQRLFKVVKEQVKMVKSLTNANVAHSAELERVRREKEEMEREYRRMQKKLARSGTAGRSGGGSSGRQQQQHAAPVGSIASEALFDGHRPLPPPPPVSGGGGGGRGVSSSTLSVADDLTVATPFTVETQLHDYNDGRPRVEMYDRQGLGPKASFPPSSGNRGRSGTDPSIDAFSTNVFPSSRNVQRQSSDQSASVLGPGVLKKKSSWRSRRSSRRSSNKPKKNYAAPLPEPTGSDKGTGCASRCWASFAFACTFFIPDFLICKSGAAAKQAWREKVAICVCVVLVSAFFVGLFGFVPLFFCTEADTYTYEDIWAKDREAWTVIHGHIYDMKRYMNIHPGGSEGIMDFLGKDSSKIFPRIPPADLPNKCLNTDKDMDNFNTMQCVDMTELDELLNLPCHKDVSKARLGVDKWLGDYKVGNLAFNGRSLRSGGETFDWIVIRDKVYNVTNYVDALKDGNSGKIVKDPEESENAYLEPTLHSLIVNKLNEDATEVYDKLYATKDYQDCLDTLFYAGVVDTRSNPACQALNIIMYVMLIFVAALLVLQCICSLLYLARGHHAFTKQDGESPVMVMVPCYSEGDKELRKTINSVIETQYPSDNKVMVVLADGNITGKGESMSTPKTLSKILGFDIDENEDASYAYKSIGALRDNRANVYSGVYEKGGKSLKYIVVVKCGIESEWGGGRAGNRGKRDSQLIITGLFNRIHHERELCELDSAINSALNTLQVPAYEIEYLMTIDADTRVHEDSINHMVWNMNKNEKILALCGETRVENKAQSWVTMLQVFEYYTNHHMKKAFESVFGCVTCLPGCFTMYRVFSVDGRSLIAQDNVFSEYARNDIESLHEKNLYLLGEDRMLTTLLLKNFPDMRLSFVPEAACWTIVPHTYSILLSQRRRWINSTFHNMLELLKVKTMCGVCCFSMKMIVILDLIATMVLPASMLYAVYFIYLVIVVGEDISILMLILYGVIMGVQVAIFLLRSRWDYLWWFAIFLVFGIPMFYFLLPIYSFAKMDDFSWGATRQVSKSAAPQKAAAASGTAKQTKAASRKTQSQSRSSTNGARSSSSRQRGGDGRHSSRDNTQLPSALRTSRSASAGRSSKPPRHSRQMSEDFGEC